MVEEQAGLLFAFQQERPQAMSTINIGASTIGAAQFQGPGGGAPSPSRGNNIGSGVASSVSTMMSTNTDDLRASLYTLLDLFRDQLEEEMKPIESSSDEDEDDGYNGRFGGRRRRRDYTGINSSLPFRSASALPSFASQIFNSGWGSQRNTQQQEEEEKLQRQQQQESVIAYNDFSHRISDCLLGAGELYNLDLPAEAAVHSSCEILYCSPPREGWNEDTLHQLESILRNPGTLPQLVIASKVGGPGMLRHALHAMLQKWKEIAEKEENSSDSDDEGLVGGPSQQRSQRGSQSQSQQAFFGSQQSQPGSILKGSNRSEALKARFARKFANRPVENESILPPRAREITASMKLLEDVLNSYSTATATATATTSVGNNTNTISNLVHSIAPRPPLEAPLEDDRNAPTNERDEEARLARLGHISAATLNFIYSLTHAVLNKVAKSEAEHRIPPYLVLSKKTILE